MHKQLVFLLILFTCSCKQEEKKKLKNRASTQVHTFSHLATDTSYTDAKKQIASRRNEFATHYAKANSKDKAAIENQVKNYWVFSIGNALYKYWAGTPWDFNGTTRTPQQGTIACGYFVTTLLLDMGMGLNRIKLSTCAASEMMQQLVPHQKIKILNSLSYNQFCDSLKKMGKGVYIIGLDYHIGFIVNDGLSCWFIHSNYISKQGVIKEPVQLSAALKASGTRWLIGLTSDKDFISRWLIVKT